MTSLLQRNIGMGEAAVPDVTGVNLQAKLRHVKWADASSERTPPETGVIGSADRGILCHVLVMRVCSHELLFWDFIKKAL